MIYDKRLISRGYEAVMSRAGRRLRGSFSCGLTFYRQRAEQQTALFFREFAERTEGAVRNSLTDLVIVCTV